MSNNVLVLIEDSVADTRVVKRAIDKSDVEGLMLVHLETVEKAKVYFEENPHTDGNRIVLLDVNLPGADGFSFLKWLKGHSEFKNTPVIMWTTSDERSDIDSAYSNGANSFVLKPMGLGEVTDLINDLCQFWFKRALTC